MVWLCDAPDDIGELRKTPKFWGSLGNTWGYRRMSRNILGMLRNKLGCLEYFGLFRNTSEYLEHSGKHANTWESPLNIRNTWEYLGIYKNTQGYVGIHRNTRDYSGLLRTFQEYFGNPMNVAWEFSEYQGRQWNTHGNLGIPRNIYECLAFPGMPRNIWEFKNIHRNTQEHLGLELMKSNIATPPLWDRKKLPKT